MSEYTKAFVIGSSWPMFILYFLGVANYADKANVSYQRYTYIAPVFLGLLNMFGLYLSKQSDTFNQHRFILTGLIGAILIAVFVTVFGMYRDVDTCWMLRYYVYLTILYIVVFGVIARYLDTAV